VRRHVQGSRLKAFIPAAPRRDAHADDRDIRMDFDTLAKAGSMLGSAAVIVMDETSCVVRSVLRLAKFFAHESCGQCTPAARNQLDGDHPAPHRERARQRSRRRPARQRVPNVGGISLCALGDAAQGPVRSLVQKFGDEIRANIRAGRYPMPRAPFFDAGAAA